MLCTNILKKVDARRRNKGKMTKAYKKHKHKKKKKKKKKKLTKDVLRFLGGGRKLPKYLHHWKYLHCLHLHFQETQNDIYLARRKKV